MRPLRDQSQEDQQNRLNLDDWLGVTERRDGFFSTKGAMS
jgi:hypothetical protein